MNITLLLRIITLVAVVTSGFLFFQIRTQKERLADNLNQSRIALQDKLKESAALQSRVTKAEAASGELNKLREEAEIVTGGLKDQLEDLSQKANEEKLARVRSESENIRLNEANRDLQREINRLKGSIPPQNWREQLNILQSRALELEAENATLKNSLPSNPQTSTSRESPTRPTQNPAIQNQTPVGEVIRIGPDGSFAIISYGRKSGAAEGQTLTIHRNQQTVALLKLTQITNDFSIAQILSSTNTGKSLSVPDIQIGDSAHLEL